MTHALESKRPSLWWTESKLGEALAKLAWTDPEGQITDVEADAFIATFVQPEALRAKRDEFATFVREAEGMLAGKRAEMEALAAQVRALEGGIEAMKLTAARIMDSAGRDALQGDKYVLALRRSRGAVVVDDADALPLRFWRVPVDADLERIRALVKMVQAPMDGAVVDRIRRALELLEAAESERRVVDKVGIQEHWKSAGEGTVPGARREVALKLVIR